MHGSPPFKKQKCTWLLAWWWGQRKWSGSLCERWHQYIASRFIAIAAFHSSITFLAIPLHAQHHSIHQLIDSPLKTTKNLITLCLAAYLLGYKYKSGGDAHQHGMAPNRKSWLYSPLLLWCRSKQPASTRDRSTTRTRWLMMAHDHLTTRYQH